MAKEKEKLIQDKISLDKMTSHRQIKKITHEGFGTSFRALE